MRLSYLNLATVASIVLASEFIIQLRDQSTIAQLLDADDLVTTASHKSIRPLVEKIIKIGDSFEAFVGNLDHDTINQLKDNPMVHDILPNLHIGMFDGPIPGDIGTEYGNITERPEDINDGNEDDQQDGIVKVQEDAPRHLARLSSREALPQNKSLGYLYTTTGEEVFAYVIDTGINIEHPQFQGRASFGASFVNESTGDLNGHGTHVAGIIGSKTYGVAKNVQLVEVKALNGQGAGSLIGILEAIQFAAEDRQKRKVKAVANMSLGSVYSGILNDAVDAAFKTGLVIVSAAGNSNSRISFFSPGSAKNSITVGALDDRTDTIAPFSNYGTKTDVFASGVFVESVNFLDFKNPIAYSGTSMASPVVAGLVATLLEANVEPKDIKAKIISLSTKDSISMTRLASWKYRNTPNRIAYNGVDEFEDGNKDDGETKHQTLEIIPYEQDFSLMKYFDDYIALEPTDKFNMDLIERSRKIHSPVWE